MGGFKLQLFYLLLQLTNVSQENLLFCPLFLFDPSQIAPKFNSLVEQCRTKIQIQLEAGYGWEGFHVKICLQKCVEIE